MKKILSIFLFVFLWVAFVYAANNFILSWNNTDTQSNSTDTWEINWDLSIEDSFSDNYKTWKRWKITWTITSYLFWDFSINNSIDLKESTKDIPEDCGDSIEVYDVSWDLLSDFWWDMSIDEDNSYFCSNKISYFKLNSNSIWEKEIWNYTQVEWEDSFDKQQIYISWVAQLSWNTGESINARWQAYINDLSVKIDKAELSANISKNIIELTRSISPITPLNPITIFTWDNSKKWKVYYYDLKWQTDTISYNSSDYINQWKNIIIEDISDKVEISWKNTLLAKNANVYIKSNIYNKDDSNSILVIVATRDRETWNGWNIYVDPSVTNIDAILIADGSLLSFDWTDILSWEISNILLRKQLLIFGSVFTSNTVWSDIMPYGSDYYEQLTDNKIDWNIYDLANLRNFNLSYWEEGLTCDEIDKLAPIDGDWNFITWAWAWWKECYIDDPKDADLRWSQYRNPVIVEYNPNLQSISPYIIQDNF